MTASSFIGLMLSKSCSKAGELARRSRKVCRYLGILCRRLGIFCSSSAKDSQGLAKSAGGAAKLSEVQDSFAAGPTSFAEAWKPFPGCRQTYPRVRISLRLNNFLHFRRAFA